MTTPHDAISDALAGAVASRTRWEEPPALYTVHLQGRRAWLKQFPLPAAVWDCDDRPEAVLTWLADRWSDVAPHLQRVAPATLHGVAFFAEQLTRDGGQEIRSFWALDKHGVTYWVYQERGKRVIDRSAYPRRAGHDFTGEALDALDRLAWVFLGARFPARRGPS